MLLLAAAVVAVIIKSWKNCACVPQLSLLATWKVSDLNIFLVSELNFFNHWIHFTLHLITALSNCTLRIYMYRRIITYNYLNRLAIGQLKTFSLRKNRRCSLTVSRSNKMLCWGQTPRLLRIWSISVRTLCPLIVADPPVGVYRPAWKKDRWGETERKSFFLVQYDWLA